MTVGCVFVGVFQPTVVCLPLVSPQCFALKNFCRIVFSSPLEKLEEAYVRMEAFCARYYVAPTPRA